MKETQFYIDITNNTIHSTSVHEHCKPFVVPTQKHEDWKYTSFKKLLQPALEPKNKYENTKFSEWEHQDFVTLIIKDGMPQGEILHPICVVREEHRNENDDTLPELLKKNRIVISFTDDVVKLRIVHLLTDATQGINSNIRILTKAHQEITVVEEYAIPDEALFFTCMNVEVVSHAHVHHHILQDLPTRSNLMTQLQVKAAEASFYNHNILTLNGNIIRNESEVVIEGEHAHVNLFGAYILRGKSHVDNKTKVLHLQPNSQSNELYKGILSDQSVGVFNGRIYVHQEAQKTQAYQSNKNILLSEEAKVYTQPQLEIFADDVKCSHGATSAQIEDAELFYLRTRGISKDTAKGFLIYAFAEAALENIRNTHYKNFLDKKIATHLNQPYI